MHSFQFSKTSRRSRFFAAAAFLVASLAVLIAPAGAAERTAQASLYDSAGGPVGRAWLVQKDGQARVHVEVRGLTAGFHGFHIHTTGQCVAPFTSAGGHFNPGGTSHGHHAGDLPLLYVNADGTGEARFTTDRFDVAGLFDADGSAIIIHAGPDNYANIPADRYDPDPDTATLATGDAGGRVACGVLEP